ncbi:MAG TPA: hypothetical protein VK208_13885 [Pyrinomonadaceae bacterium]|jgi:hypothetical protein|nr:hypothetical protein [Pyrinomonadaceae bacterium]
MAHTFLLLLATIPGVFFCSSAAAPQAREHLTPQEIEMVKDAQELDKRIDVFIKAANRRLLVLSGTTDANNAKQVKKDSETWGELPTGSRTELIGDIARIFDEAITNLDDVSARDENNPMIPKALRRLAAAATRIVEQLKSAEAQAKGEAELSNFDLLTENAESILQAASKLPPPVEKKSKSKTDKP